MNLECNTFRAGFILTKKTNNTHPKSELYIPANLVYSTTMGRSRHRPPVDHDACGTGFIAQLGSAEGSREVVERALEALRRLSHRGGVDADGSSGDGAGLLTPIPDEFFRARTREAGIELPERFGLGVVFLSREGAAAACGSIEEFARATRDCSVSVGERFPPILEFSGRRPRRRSP
jgi:glutamate synthase (NADPH/NADH) large chain